MTKFDPNATPECDKLREYIPGIAEFILIEDAQELERRARIAEHELKKMKEQLIIAKHNLLAISELGTASDTHVQFAKYALEKIEGGG